jgi:hypothetical protein
MKHLAQAQPKPVAKATSKYFTDNCVARLCWPCRRIPLDDLAPSSGCDLTANSKRDARIGCMTNRVDVRTTMYELYHVPHDTTHFQLSTSHVFELLVIEPTTMKISSTLASSILIVHRGDDTLGPCCVADALMLPRCPAGGFISLARLGFYGTTKLDLQPLASRVRRASDPGEWHSPRTCRATSARLCSLKGQLNPKGVVGSLRGGGSGTGSGIGPPAAPPLTSWIGPTLSCGLSYALYNLFIKRASSLMDPMLGGVLLQVVAAALGSCLWLVTSSRNAAAGPALITRGGIGWYRGGKQLIAVLNNCRLNNLNH